MESDPRIFLSLAALAALFLVFFIVDLVNLGTYFLIRPSKRVPFGTIRHRALTLQQVLIPGLLALLTGLFVSLAGNFLFQGLRERDEMSQQIGFVLFAVVFVAFMIIGTVWVRGGMEIGDLAKDPTTIAAAANTLHGLSPDDGKTLRQLRRHLADWRKQSGRLAFLPGTKKSSQPANDALWMTVPRGRPPVRSRWRLLPMMLRLSPLSPDPPMRFGGSGLV